MSAWETDAAVTHLAWAHPEYGRVLAGGTSTGSVLVWGQLPELQVQASLGLGPGAGAGGAGGGGEAAGGFQPLAELPCGTAPCRWVYHSTGREEGVSERARTIPCGLTAVPVHSEQACGRANSLHWVYGSVGGAGLRPLYGWGMPVRVRWIVRRLAVGVEGRGCGEVSVVWVHGRTRGWG